MIAGARTGPLVSVVIPAYNAERYLADAVGSALGQSYRRLEVIVVDDGSTDGTAAMADAFAAAEPRVRVLRQRNGGPSAARNAGIAAATGELLCFLDADDLLLPDKLERQEEFLRLFPRCDLVYSDHYVGDAQLTPLFLISKKPPLIPMRQLLAYRNWFAPMSALMRTGLIERVGRFDESLRSAEDWDFWIRASRGGVLSYLPGPVGVYRSHPGQAHHDTARMLRNQEEVIAKHFEQGSIEWRITRATRAWERAKEQWVERSYFGMAVSVSRSLWYARSRRTMRNVIALTTDFL